MIHRIPGLCRLRAWRRRQDFVPGPFAWLVNPFVFARRGLWRGLGEFFGELRGEVLDVGCGTKPYRTSIPAERYVGLDIDNPLARLRGGADVYYDGGRFPFPDGSFDGVLCSQVFEHVFNPSEFLVEIRRVLRPGGTLLLSVPFVWDEHEQPHDFARYSSFGLRAVLAQEGFEVVAIRKTCADARVLWQLGTGYIFKYTHSQSRWANWLMQLVLIAPLNLAGELIWWLLPRNPDLYLDTVVLARRPAA